MPLSRDKQKIGEKATKYDVIISNFIRFNESERLLTMPTIRIGLHENIEYASDEIPGLR